jgi:nucleoside-diphosphate-sugar epimerase
MVRDVLAALAGPGGLRHVALVTGLKHYMGPFEAYGTGEIRDTPFHEDEPRLSVPNFYYAQEDELWSSAERHSFSWSVHRSHTIIGHAVGNAMNMGMTLAVQASVCRARGMPFVFPGNEVQWNGLTDMTDAGLLARHRSWAAQTGDLPSQAYNVANGDLFRWRWMWPRIARLLDVKPEGYEGRPRPLEEQMYGLEQMWADLAARNGLAENDLARVASWWHTDGDLNRPIECFTDMSRSRKHGFTEYVSTLDSFSRLFTSLKQNKIIP